jgi:TolA-binding protein
MIPRRALTHTRLACALLLALCFAPPHAYAVNKDMVELQTEIQQLQDAVARLQKSNDENMGVLKDLVQQSADSVNKMSLAIEALQKQAHTESDATGGKVDQVSSQVQALNDSLDEVKARLNSLEKALQGVQSTQQSINAVLQNLTPAPASPPGAAPPGPGAPGSGAPGYAPGTGAAGSAPGGGSPQLQGPPTPNNAAPSAGGPGVVPTPAPAPIPAKPAAPPLADLYQTALNDFSSAKNALAMNEFAQVIRFYPDNSLSGNAYYYMGEIDYKAGKFTNAVKDYDHVLQQFPDNQKVPVAHLHKGQALLILSAAATGARKAELHDAGIDEFRSLIARFPHSPEAAIASRLAGSAPATPKRPT